MSMSEITRFQLKKLNELENEKDIAAFLTEKGVTGHRASPMRCPVANYLRGCAIDEFGDDSLEKVSLTGVHFHDHWCTTPCKVTEFILDFDNRLYPKLFAIEE